MRKMFARLQTVEMKKELRPRTLRIYRGLLKESKAFGNNYGDKVASGLLVKDFNM